MTNKLVSTFILLFFFTSCSLAKAGVVTSLTYHAAATVARTNPTNGLGAGGLDFGIGWEFPDFMAIEFHYTKFEFTKTIEGSDPIEAKMDNTQMEILFRFIHSSFFHSRLGLASSTIESRYTTASGTVFATDQDGTVMAIHLGIDAVYPIFDFLDIYGGLSLYKPSPAMMILSLDIGIRYHYRF